jgi:ANTAR domain
VERDSAEPTRPAAQQLAAVRLEYEAQVRRFEAARARLAEIMDQNGRMRSELLRNSASARMHARLASLPVIEQAKGILMAQRRCQPEEAFDLLRRASQRANVKVSVLASLVVQSVASPTAGSKALPAQLAGAGHPGRARFSPARPRTEGLNGQRTALGERG